MKRKKLSLKICALCKQYRFWGKKENVTCEAKEVRVSGRKRLKQRDYSVIRGSRLGCWEKKDTYSHVEWNRVESRQSRVQVESRVQNFMSAGAMWNFGRLSPLLRTSSIHMAGPQPLTSDELQEKLEAFDSIPLFMKSLPDEDPADNASLAALQSLVYEGTPDGQWNSSLCAW